MHSAILGIHIHRQICVTSQPGKIFLSLRAIHVVLLFLFQIKKSLVLNFYFDIILVVLERPPRLWFHLIRFNYKTRWRIAGYFWSRTSK